MTDGPATPVDQGTADRYTVVPRTLLFFERDDHVLLLRGADHKWFAGMYNGVGGHVEPGEDVVVAARREAVEETGLTPTDLALVAIIHVVGAQPGVMLFVFRARAHGEVQSTDEGTLEWVPIDRITTYPLVPDLTWLVPRVLSNDTTVFTATFRFETHRLTIELPNGEVETISL